MVKSPKSHDHDHDEFEECDFVGTNGSCSRSGDGKSKDQKTTAHRSKHSETEQRRRSKINERNNCGPAESIVDHSQVIKNGFGLENNVAPPALLTNAQNTPESELGTAAVYKAMNHPTGSATPAVPSNLQMKPNIFDPVVRGGVPAWSLQESISDAENMPSQPQSQWWHARPYPTEDAAQNNMSEHELAVDSGSVSISSAYSQEILNSLAQELQSSGVDLSQANISVQINVGKSANSALNAVASNSKDGEKQSLNDQVMAHTAVGSCHNDSGLAHKRLRTEES